MIKALLMVLQGSLLWKGYKKNYSIDSDTAVVIITDNKPEWRSVALRYAENYKNKCSAKKIVVLDEMSMKEAEALFSYMIFSKAHPHIVFIDEHYPIYNQTSMIVERTDMSIEEIICLGFYNLRSVPDMANSLMEETDV